MEAALVSGFIKIIVPRLFSLSSDKYKLNKSVKCNVEFLQHELEMIARTIDDQISKGEHLSSARTQWIQELRQLAYEIEDCIDRYVYRLTYKQQASSIRRATMVLDNFQFADEIRKLREKVKEPCERIRRYTSDDSQWSTPVEPLAPAYDPLTKKADLVGIDVPQEELLDLLEDDEVERRRKVVSIVGFNGVGKTVLAEQVYNSDAAKQFSPKAWIDAQEKDAKDVLLSLHLSLGLHNEPQGTSNVKLLSSKLEGHLQDKRYLVVIDDMRTELWSTIGSAFPDNKGLGCRIIVTTPIQSIAYACSSEDCYIYKMRGLGQKHSAQLFKRKGPKVELEQTQILKKCDGLPLALVSIAQFMSKKCVPNGTSCKDVCNRLGYYLETDKDTLARMQGVLAKNYASLNGHQLKACLLYLGLFPSEHPIRKKRLLRRWLAEGLVHTQDLAVMNFQEFIDRNIIRPIDVSYNEKVKTCRTCGMMLEFIIRKSISQDFITLCCDGIVKLLCDQGGQPKCVRRLCLHRRGTANANESFGNVSLVRSLTIFNEADETLVDFGKCQLLRVLDLEECNNLSEEKLTGICNLLLLKYLSLGGTITKLPRDIANLEFLQTLDIRRTNVRRLPIDIISLPFLIHLLGKFRLTGKAKQMSRAEQFLSSGKSNLRTLAGFIAGESEGFLQLLSHMNNLRKIKAWSESTSGSNGTAHLVEAVQKYIQDDEEEEQTNQDDRSLSLHFKVSSLDFHSLKGPCYLSSLKLHGALGTTLPPFVSFLRDLRELCLSTTTLTADMLATVSKLRYLQYLKLIVDQLEEFFIEAGAFLKLLRLCLVLQHPNNNILVIKEGALSELVALQLLFKGLNGPSSIKIANLKSLKEVTLHPDQSVKLDQWQQAARDHPNRPSVELLGTVDPMDDDVVENSSLQDEKSTPETVTQRPLQDHSSSSSRLKVPQENDNVLKCRSEEIKKMSPDHEYSLASRDLSNVACATNLSSTTY